MVAGRHQRAREIQAHAPAARRIWPPACRVAWRESPGRAAGGRRGQWRPSRRSRPGAGARGHRRPSLRCGAGRRLGARRMRVHLGIARQHEVDGAVGQAKAFPRDAGDAQACWAGPSSSRSGSASPWITGEQAGPAAAVAVPTTPTREPACRVRSTADRVRRSPRRRAKLKRSWGDLEGARIVPERRMAWYRNGPMNGVAPAALAQSASMREVVRLAHAGVHQQRQGDTGGDVPVEAVPVACA